MFTPEDLIRDEEEYPEQTRQLQQHYPRSRADQQSLLRIHTHLMEQRSAMFSHAATMQDLPAGETFDEHADPAAWGLQMGIVPPKPFQRKQDQQPHHPLPGWISTLAAVLLVGVLIGSFVAVLAIQKSARQGGQGTPTPSPTTAPDQSLLDPFGIKMTSTTGGWAFDDDISSGRLVRTIARTTNGGKTWQKFDFQGKNAEQFGSFFLDDQTAWVIMGSPLNVHTNKPLLRTTDGGQHWQALQMPPAMSNMTFIDRQHGWAWALGSVGPDGQETTFPFYRTVDGGMTWTRIGQMSTARTPGTSTLRGPLPFSEGLGFTFLTPQRGWAILYPSFTQASQRAFLYMTQDGGATWQYQPLLQPASGPIPGIQTTLQGSSQAGADITIYDPTFFTSQEGVLRIASQSLQGPRIFYLYETTDGGLHWSPLGTRIEAGGTSSSPFFTEIPDPTHFLLWNGQQMTLYALVNSQWQPQHSLQMPGIVGYFTFVTSQHGWFLIANGSSETLYMTADGGVTWRTVTRMSVSRPSQQGG